MVRIAAPSARTGMTIDAAPQPPPSGAADRPNAGLACRLSLLPLLLR
jgi:hypothetical protein